MFMKIMYARRSCSEATEGNTSGNRRKATMYLPSTSNANAARRFSGLVCGTSSESWNALQVQIAVVPKQLEMMFRVPRTSPPDTQRSTMCVPVRAVEISMRIR